MAKPRVLVLRAPGTNCDEETLNAFERVGGTGERIHINRLLESPNLIDEFQIFCVPGGFSYGDDVAAGKILAGQFQSHLGEQMRRFRDDGKLLLGICNGFQVLLKSGLLWSNPEQTPPATLTWNDNGRYESRWVKLHVEAGNCVFLRDVEQMYLPVAHAEGKIVFRDSPSLDEFRGSGQIALRYANGAGIASGYPDNPNGSQESIAGICDPSGRAFGLMPHPERFIDATQHPRWTREGLQDEADGVAIFRNAVRFFE